MLFRKVVAVFLVVAIVLSAGPARATCNGVACGVRAVRVRAVNHVFVPQQVFVEQQVLVPAYDHGYSFSGYSTSKDTQQLTKEVRQLTKNVNTLATSLKALSGGGQAPEQADPGLAVFQKRCLSCHSGPQPNGKPQFADADGKVLDLADGVKRAIFSAAKYGAMPPQENGKQPLSNEEFAALEGWLYPSNAPTPSLSK